jgi:hypothetical protein
VERITRTIKLAAALAATPDQIYPLARPLLLADTAAEQASIHGDVGRLAWPPGLSSPKLSLPTSPAMEGSGEPGRSVRGSDRTRDNKADHPGPTHAPSAGAPTRRVRDMFLSVWMTKPVDGRQRAPERFDAFGHSQRSSGARLRSRARGTPNTLLTRAFRSGALSTTVPFGSSTTASKAVRDDCCRLPPCASLKTRQLSGTRVC